jgi:hypothetical protein
MTGSKRDTDARQRGERLGRSPDAHREPREPGGALRRQVGRIAPDHGTAEHVGLELHQVVVAAGAAVGEERVRCRAVLSHRLEHVTNLVGDGVDRRARDVRGGAAAGGAADQPARVGVPVGGAEAGERRHHVHPIGVRHRSRERRDSAGGVCQPEQAAQPVHRTAGHRDIAFERVGGRLGTRPRHRGGQPVSRGERLRDRRHQRRPGAVGRLDAPVRERRVPEQRGVRVADGARHRHAAPRDDRARPWCRARRSTAARGEQRQPGCRTATAGRRSQARARRLNSCVREALVWSQAWTAPPVRFHTSQLSIVPAHSSPPAARWPPSGHASSSQRILPAEKSGSMVRPDRSSRSSRAPRRRSSSQNGAVRRHCHTITGPMGRPVARSQTSTDSRWLLMPTASTCEPRGAREALVDCVLDGAPQREGILFDPARLREPDVDGPAGARDDLAALVVQQDLGVARALVDGQDVACRHGHLARMGASGTGRRDESPEA